MKKLSFLLCMFPVTILNLYGQTALEKEIISDLIHGEFCPVLDESAVGGNRQIKDPKDQEEGSIIIITETIPQMIDADDSLWKFQRDGLAGLDLHTWNDFIEKNRSSVSIPEFDLDKLYIIFISQSEYDELMEQGGWSRYHEIYGYIPRIQLSRPGISKAKNKALIYYDAISDKLGGAGFFIILEKVGDKWMVKEKIIAWRS